MPKQFHALRSLTTLALLALVPAAAAAAIGTEVADVRAGGDGVVWQPQIHDYDRLTLIVAGPGGTVTREFGAGELPSFSLYDAAGGLVADGLYKWELRVTPRLDAATRRAMETEREGGGARRILGQLRASGALPAATYQSGAFSVVGGALAMPGDLVEGAGPGIRSQSSPVRSITAPATVLATNDGVIRLSLCVGIDCPNSPSFSDTTILMMENNTRIKFDDTSNTASFPNNDWEIEANSSLNGGANYLGFNDCGVSSQGGCATDLVFAVEAGVRQNALYVETDGDVGLGTSNPAVNLHVVDGNTPTLRLEQDGSSGFTPQIWDIAGNEANFFVRDVTGGSQLPFRIEPGTASNTLYLDSNERVGIGTSAPSETLHVRGTGGTTKAFVEEASGSAAQRTLLQLTNNGGTEFRMTDTSTSVTWLFQNTGGNFRFTDAGDAFNEFILTGDGDLTITGEIFTAGSCSLGCDEVFAPEFELRTIEEHSALMWRNRHLPAVGPTAENGRWNLSRKTGGILHELEVAHIYIQQLNDGLKAKTDELAELEQQNAELAERRLPELERANAELAARLATLEALVQQLAD